MKDKSRFKLLSEGLRQRTQETYDTREDRRRGILDRSKTSGMTMFEPSTGEHLIEFLPYVAGAKDPHKPGSPTYLVDLFVHRYIGPNEDDFICLSKTYGQPCSICEHRNKLRKQDEPHSEEDKARLKAEIESCRPKRYTVYAIWDRDNETKGVQLWVIAHWFVQMNLMSACKNRKTGGVIPFAAPDREEGRSVAFAIEGTKMSQQYRGWQLYERDDDIPDEILDRVPVLDELLDIPTYQEVEKAFWAGLEVKEAPAKEEQSFTGAARKKVPEDGCPFDGIMGKDFEKFEECESICEKYQECHDLNKAMKSGKDEDEGEEKNEELGEERPRPKLREVSKDPEEDSPRRRRRP